VPENVFQPARVQLFRAPGAPVLDGWSVLRVRVTAENDNSVRLPAVHVRVFRSPRGDGDAPIGQGMTEWRGNLLGEALVGVADLLRFRSGAGDDVFETTQPVHLEATRDSNFPGAGDQFPDIPGFALGTRTRRSDPPANVPALVVNPLAPLDLRAGQEATVHLAMP